MSDPNVHVAITPGFDDLETMLYGRLRSHVAEKNLWHVGEHVRAIELTADLAAKMTGVMNVAPSASFTAHNVSWGVHLADECALLYQWNGSGPSVRLRTVTAAATEAQLKALEEDLEIIFPDWEKPEGPPRDDRVIDLNFWTTGPHGPQCSRRSIATPAWREIAGNYPGAADLAPLMDPAYRPDGDGKLLLFHSAPGTGKTHAVRSLMHAWQDWCVPHYIVDSEQFFGDAQYMMAMAMNLHGRMWNLLVVEDAGELLREDAADRSGQGLGRLLNLTDGLIGQGLRMMVLITTNEPIEELHKAVQREGRCLANLHFDLFSPESATAWLRRYDPQAPEVTEPTALSGLFSRLPKDKRPRLEITDADAEPDLLDLDF